MTTLRGGGGAMHPFGVAESPSAPPAVLGTPAQHPSGWLA